MALDAGEVFVLVAARIDNASIAKGTAAFETMKAKSNEAQASFDRMAVAQNAAMANYAAASKRGEDASKRLGDAMDRVKSSAVLAGKVSAVGVVGIATALGGAALAAVGFDSSMRNVNSIAKLGQGNFALLEKQVLRLAPAIGSSPTDLAKGLYDIVSTGYKASDAIKILAVSAKAGKAGLTDTATATSAITGALKAYGLGAGDARKVSDIFFQEVDTGKNTFEELAGSIGTVLAPAAHLGVPLKEVASAMATLTLESIDAHTATTDLRGIFVAFQKPTKDLTAVFKDNGYATAQAGLQSLGLKGSLELLEKSVASGHNTWVDFFKDVRALQGAEGLEGSTAAIRLFNTSTAAMADATKGAGATQAAFAEQSKSTAVQFDKLKASVDVAAITIGSALLPRLNDGIQALSHWFQGAEKSGEINVWAADVSNAVTDVLEEIRKLGPDAEAAFHLIASTVQAALPFVEDLYHAFHAAEPAIADVAHAAAGLVKVLGPGPILGAVGAFKALQIAGLGAEVGVGRFAGVMKAGTLAIAGTVDGGVNAAGKITGIGAAAAESEGKVSIFSRGLVSTIGSPTLIAVGAAGIVLGILAIARSVTTVKDEAQDAVNALAELEGGRVAKAAALAGVADAKASVASTRKASGDAAASLAAARAAAPPSAPGAPPDPKVAAAYANAAQKARDAHDAVIALAQAHQNLAIAQGKDDDAAKKFGDQLYGFVDKARNAGDALEPIGRLGGTLVPPSAAQKLDTFVSQLRNYANTTKDITPATRDAALAVADFSEKAKRVPSKAETKIIADDLEAGLSTAKIIAQLGWIAKARPRPKISVDVTSADATIAEFSRRIAALHNKTLTISEVIAGGGSPASRLLTPKGPQAMGGYANTPSIGIWGEDGPEYTIPVGPKYHASGMSLWMQAGKALGVPGFAAGKAPKKPPIPKKPQFLAFPLAHYQTVHDQADATLKSDESHLRGYAKDQQRINKTIGEAHARAAKAKDRTKSEKATKAQLQKAAAELEKRSQPELGRLTNLIANEQALIQDRDEPKLAEATRVLKAAKAYAGKIAVDTDAVTQATDDMTLASNRWSAANTALGSAKTPKAKAAAQAEMAKQLAVYNAAAKRRSGADQALEALFAEADGVIKDNSAYWRETRDKITQAKIDDTNASDVTSAPGYQAPDDSAPSTDIGDYLNPWEVTAQSQIDEAAARAAADSDLGGALTAAQNALGLAQEEDTRLEAAGAPVDVITQALQAVTSAKQNLDSAQQAVTDATTAATSVTSDQQAQLDQQTAIATAAQQNADSANASLKAFQESGDLFGGTTHYNTINVGVKALSAGSPVVQRAVGEAVAKAFGAQPFVPNTTGFYNG